MKSWKVGFLIGCIAFLEQSCSCMDLRTAAHAHNGQIQQSSNAPAQNNVLNLLDRFADFYGPDPAWHQTITDQQPNNKHYDSDPRIDQQAILDAYNNILSFDTQKPVPQLPWQPRKRKRTEGQSSRKAKKTKSLNNKEIIAALKNIFLRPPSLDRERKQLTDIVRTHICTIHDDQRKNDMANLLNSTPLKEQHNKLLFHILAEKGMHILISEVSKHLPDINLECKDDEDKTPEQYAYASNHRFTGNKIHYCVHPHNKQQNKEIKTINR